MFFHYLIIVQPAKLEAFYSDIIDLAAAEAFKMPMPGEGSIIASFILLDVEQLDNLFFKKKS